MNHDKMEETNGGRHSRLGLRYDAIDPTALRVLAAILCKGAESHQDNTGENWRKIPVNIHLNHAVAHIYDYLCGESESGDDHLGNAFCRLMMAVAEDKNRNA